MVIRTWLAAAALAALPACVTFPAMHPLSDTAWQLVAIDTSGSTTTLTPALQERHTIIFLDDGEMQLQLDCNRGRASWIADQSSNGAGAISIGPVAGTKMLCPRPSFGDDLASGLGEAERFMLTIDGRQLVLEAPDLRFTFSPLG